MVTHQERQFIVTLVALSIVVYCLVTMIHCCMRKECDSSQILSSKTNRLKDEPDQVHEQSITRKALETGDLILFKNRTISTILQTPNYRWFDDKAISAQNNIYLEKYKLHYCKIDKNMGSTMQATFCYIDDQRGFSKLFFNNSWQHGLDNTECGNSTAYGSLRKRFLKAAEDTDFFAENSGIYHFSIIRHPISRFISAFIDICVNRAGKPHLTNKLCFACRGSLDCFVPKLHDYLYKQSVHRPVNKWSLDWHFLPQSWYCDYDRHLDKYDRLIRYGRNDQFRTELVNMLGKRGVPPDLLSDIEKQLKTKKNLHATFDRSSEYEKKLMNNPLLLEYVYKIYHLDFVWFCYRLNTTNTGE